MYQKTAFSSSHGKKKVFQILYFEYTCKQTLRPMDGRSYERQAQRSQLIIATASLFKDGSIKKNE